MTHIYYINDIIHLNHYNRDVKRVADCGGAAGPIIC
jgi:hypothetical protein